ncbi:hypothetical protein ACIF6L_12200 [Kitasatospora sp. NPDC086009]|uniref:hypothetical protein n=1 Tax=unclassified Kitasatospora TaxID=2633591 RepID=UPI0037C71A07
MSLKTTRRASAVRSLAGTVLTTAVLVSAATACSSSPGTAAGTAAPTTAATGAPGATGTPAPTGTPGSTGTAAPSTAPSTAPGTAPGTAKPTATPTARPTTPPAVPPKATSPGHTQTLVDGSTAEIQDLGNQNYRAKIVSRGSVLATLETNNSDTGLDANDMFVVLSMDGQVHSWMGGAQQGPGTFKLAGGWTAKVTKVGELHYRAQILGMGNEEVGTLEANQQDDGAVANGVYIVLSTGGRISAHM